MAFGTALPIVFVWSLPLLASFDVYVHRCNDFPHCRSVYSGHCSGESVSDMTCTPAATGLMAATFFWPIMHLWMSGAQLPDSRVAYVLIVMFQIFFSLFLTAPVVYVAKIHSVVVSLFCLCAVLHLGFMIWECLQRRFLRCVVCLTVASCMLASIVCIQAAAQLDKRFFERGPVHAWCFYVCEATGLSAVALFPGIWRRTDEPRPLGRVVSEFFGEPVMRPR